jgi:hypothetical protein
MRTIDRDASSWTTVLDFYGALLAAIGAPTWHGKSIDALVDSMIWGGINAVEPPYTIRVQHLAGSPPDVIRVAQLAKHALAQGRTDFRLRRGCDVDVNLEVSQ